MKKKAIGSRGSWFATIDGEAFPCVHEYWWRKGGFYHDPNARPEEGKWIEFIGALKTKKRAILTKDKVLDELLAFERLGYVALFEIDDVIVDGPNLTFRFGKRIAELE